MNDTNIGLNIGIDTIKLLHWLVSWTRKDKDKGMTLYQYYKKLK